MAVAGAGRLYMAVATPLLYDEYQWIALADSVDLRPGQINLPLHGDQHPPGQVYMAAVGAAILGPNLLGYRAASVVLGTLAVALMYVLGRRLDGPPAGLFAAFLLATNEYHLGISRVCTEKNYLTFALIGLLLFERALATDTTRHYLLTGVVMGMAALTKQAAYIWVLWFGVVAGWRSSLRSMWRQPHLWFAAAAFTVVVAPDLYWTLQNLDPADSRAPGDLGITYQLSRLRVGTWSWGPFALYARPLYYYTVESEISEYASMTVLPGAIVLLGAAASLFVCRSRLARRLQFLGFGTFLFFCLFTNPGGEFWWADLALIPFTALAAGALLQLKGARRYAHAAVVGVMLSGALRVGLTEDNYFPLDVGSPSREAVERCRTAVRLQMTRYRDRDHLELCSLGSLRLPACRVYAALLGDLQAMEHAEQSSPGDPRLSLTPEASEWVAAERARFQAALGSQ